VGTWDLGVTPALVQRKDTWLLGPVCEGFGDHGWDAPHSDDVPGIHDCNHCRVYCTRASLTMLNNFFKGDISQDFASWLMFRMHEPAAKNRLGHGMGASDKLVSAGIKLAFEEAQSVRMKRLHFPRSSGTSTQVVPSPASTGSSLSCHFDLIAIKQGVVSLWSFC
jgi:hypothetical protein